MLTRTNCSKSIYEWKNIRLSKQKTNYGRILKLYGETNEKT